MTETMKVLDRPKSKWPYWILFTQDSDSFAYVGEFYHIMRKFEMMKDKIEFRMERQWGKYTGASGRKYKQVRGVLYKFQKEEDRLVFLMGVEH